MNKRTKMQTQKVNRLYRAGRICLLSAVALLSLGSCRDDIQEPKASSHESTHEPSIDSYIGKVDIALEATLEPMPDQGERSLNFTLMDRTERIGVDGKTLPAGTDYTDEVAPRMYLTEGSTVSGFLIFLHDNGQVLRKSVNFKVIEGVKKANGTIVPTAKNRVAYVGNIDFPDGMKLLDEFNKSSNTATDVYATRLSPSNVTKNSGWHVMAMIGYQYSSSYYPNGKDAEGSEVVNRLLFGSSLDETFDSGTQSYDFGGAVGTTIELNTPCASAWMPLYVTRPSTATVVTGVNYDLHFKPQGVILQYDLASMAIDAQDLRCIGIVSNVLDFKGYYDLNSASIKAAYDSRDGDNYGLPKWIPNPVDMGGLSMHYAPASAAPLTSGTRVFPWDMPTMSSTKSNSLDNWGGEATNTWPVEQPAVLSIYPRGQSSESVTGRPNSYPWLKAKKLWTFYTLGGDYMLNSRGRVITKTGYYPIYFWGMPRGSERMPAANKQATYFFVSSHSLITDDDAWDAGVHGFDTKVYLDLFNYAVRTYNKLLSLEREIAIATDADKKKEKQDEYDQAKRDYEINPDANPYRDHFPGAVLPALKMAQAKLAEILSEAQKTKITPRTQPLMILHQTNRTFPERRVYHAQAVIRPDLMLSEVIYQKHDNQNYTLLEVYNPTVEPIDLSLYAVVRLIPSADQTYLTFRGPDGNPVESLEQALVLPLTALKGQVDPFDGSKLSTLKLATYNYDEPTKRAQPVYYDPYTYTTTSTGRWAGKYYYSKLIDNNGSRSLYVLRGQSLLLGGSGYINKPVMNSDNPEKVLHLLDENSWFKPLHALLKANFDKYYLRYAYAYADGVKGADGNFGEGTLDYRPGDAFALVKKTDTGWQIIDATGPVGRKHLAFAGTYATFKAEMDKVKGKNSFSQQRLDGVDYPFIAPYRTKRLDLTKWSDDWNILTEVNQFTPGRRFDYSGWEHTFGSFEYPIRRSPIDTQFTTYQNARPTKNY